MAATNHDTCEQLLQAIAKLEEASFGGCCVSNGARIVVLKRLRLRLKALEIKS